MTPEKLDELYAMANTWIGEERSMPINPILLRNLIDRVRELERALDNAVYLEPKLLRIANISNARAALNKE